MGKIGDKRRKFLEGGSDFRKRQLNRIYVRDCGHCQLCFLPVEREKATRDHILEITYISDKKLARSDENVRLAHKQCNIDRSNNINSEDYIARHESIVPDELTQPIRDFFPSSES